MLSDWSRATRSLFRRSGQAGVVVVVLAMAFGTAGTIYTVANGTIVRPLPLRDADRLVWMWNARTERARAPFSIADLLDYRAGNQVLDDLSPFTNWTANLTGAAEAVRLEGLRVGANFFDVLGATPLHGRLFVPGDDAAAGSNVAVLTHALWQRQFGGDLAVVGRSIVLNRTGFTVVGVLPASFTFPFRTAELAVPLPLDADPRRVDRGANFLRVVARLRPDVSLEQAKADLDRIAASLRSEHPEPNARKIGVNLFPLRDEIVGDYRRLLLTLAAAVAVLLVIACGNLTNLLSVHLAGRLEEIRTHYLIGARPRRIVRQLLMESGIAGFAGGVAALAVAWLGVRLIVLLAPEPLPRQAEINLDPLSMTLTVAAATLAAIMCATVPTLQAVRTAIRSGTAGRHITANRRQALLRRTFLAMQAAGSVTLVVCAVLLVRSYSALVASQAGFTPDSLLIFQLSLPPDRYNSPAALEQFAERLGGRLQSTPGVASAGCVSLAPLSGLLSSIDYYVSGRPVPQPAEVPQAHYRVASAGYFAAAGIPLLEGRGFGDVDRTDAAPVVVVSRSLAVREWPGTSPVGQRIRIPDGTAKAREEREIVGVVADVRQFALDGPITADLYVPLPQVPATQTRFLATRTYWTVRSTGVPPLTLGPGVRRILRELDADIAASSMQSGTELIAASLGARRFNLRLLQMFSGAALALCLVGIYAVTMSAAAQRRRELAIRAACGAAPSSLARTLIAPELLAVGGGTITGLAIASVLVPSLRSLLYGVEPLDPLAFGAAAAGILGTAAAGTIVPAARLRTLDIARELRTDAAGR